MKKYLCIAFSAIILFSCKNNNKAPDVSHIKIDLKTERFEQDFFKIDSNRIDSSLDILLGKHPDFTPYFIYTVLNANPSWKGDTTATYLKRFLTSYRPVYDTSQMIYKNFSKYENEIKEGLRYLKFYFPQYKIPGKIITYLGPADGFGDGFIEDNILVGLQHHLGSSFSVYKDQMFIQTYPEYLSRRFTPEYISVNTISNIVNVKLFPQAKEDQSLLIQMVEKGKRLYLLQLLLPNTEEYKLIGYTEKQMKESYSHEAAIWDLFVQNNFLQTIDYNVIKNYIGESPKTQELGESSPGNIGSFAGWQIVKKYMSKNPSTRPDQLMAMDAEQLFTAAKYKP